MAQKRFWTVCKWESKQLLKYQSYYKKNLLLTEEMMVRSNESSTDSQHMTSNTINIESSHTQHSDFVGLLFLCVKKFLLPWKVLFKILSSLKVSRKASLAYFWLAIEQQNCDPTANFCMYYNQTVFENLFVHNSDLKYICSGMVKAKC